MSAYRMVVLGSQQRQKLDCVVLGSPGSRIRSLCALLLLWGGAVACAEVTEPAADTAGISLSVPSLGISPGETQAVTVTVSRKSGSAQLSIAGLPAGVDATFSRAVLMDGESQSVLTLSADSTANHGLAAVTIGAIISGAAGTALTTERKVILTLQVSNCPAYAIPSSCPPFATGGSWTISGMVVERTPNGTRPLAGVSVWAWVQRPTNGYSRGSVVTDATGRYTITDLPDARIVLQAWGSFDQPCGAMVELAGTNATANIELVSQAAPIVLTEPPPPALVGVVYEVTATGQRPIAGARVYFDTFMDNVAAVTTTDAQGRYSLCSLPVLYQNQDVIVVKAGYKNTNIAVSVSGVKRLDIQMGRE